MNKFKIGDRVRLTNASLAERNISLHEGAIGTVLEDCTCPYVAWDNWSMGHSGGTRDSNRRDVWCVIETELELAP